MTGTVKIALLVSSVALVALGLIFHSSGVVTFGGISFVVSALVEWRA